MAGAGDTGRPAHSGRALHHRPGLVPDRLCLPAPGRSTVRLPRPAPGAADRVLLHPAAGLAVRRPGTQPALHRPAAARRLHPVHDPVHRRVLPGLRRLRVHPIRPGLQRARTRAVPGGSRPARPARGAAGDRNPGRDREPDPVPAEPALAVPGPGRRRRPVPDPCRPQHRQPCRRRRAAGRDVVAAQPVPVRRPRGAGPEPGHHRAADRGLLPGRAGTGRRRAVQPAASRP